MRLAGVSDHARAGDKALVLEVRGRNAIILDPDGRFIRMRMRDREMLGVGDVLSLDSLNRNSFIPWMSAHRGLFAAAAMVFLLLLGGVVAFTAFSPQGLSPQDPGALSPADAPVSTEKPDAAVTELNAAMTEPEAIVAERRGAATAEGGIAGLPATPSKPEQPKGGSMTGGQRPTGSTARVAQLGTQSRTQPKTQPEAKPKAHPAPRREPLPKVRPAAEPPAVPASPLESVAEEPVAVAVAPVGPVSSADGKECAGTPADQAGMGEAQLALVTRGASKSPEDAAAGVKDAAAGAEDAAAGAGGGVAKSAATKVGAAKGMLNVQAMSLSKTDVGLRLGTASGELSIEGDANSGGPGENGKAEGDKNNKGDEKAKDKDKDKNKDGDKAAGDESGTAPAAGGESGTTPQ